MMPYKAQSGYENRLQYLFTVMKYNKAHFFTVKIPENGLHVKR